MQWSNAALSVWGKTERNGFGWMPLPRHLEHAAHMAGHLWDSFNPSSIRQLLTEATGLTDNEARDLCRFYAGVHDVGKASPTFACQAPPQAASLLDAMRDHGMTTPSRLQVPHFRHEAVSQLELRRWLMEKGVPKASANAWASPLGSHHGRNPSASHLMEAIRTPDALGTGAWAEVRAELVDGIARLTDVEERLPSWATHPLPATAQAVLGSLIVLADWMASNVDFFPYDDDEAPEARAALAFEQIGLPHAWQPDPASDADSLLHARFPHLSGVTARPLQVALVEAALTCHGAPLLIVEGPMGVGKTEAALLASEILAARFGQGGVYFGLPTMATANPMFDRTLDWLGHALDGGDASVALAHGKAHLNDSYSELIRQSWRGQVYDDEGRPESGHAVVNGWLRGRRRSGLASFVVGTIDQVLFAGLKAKHVGLRHLGLAGKVVVIDEVHAADVYMRTYLKRVLTWLAAYGTPVILMSATLPPAQRDEFVEAYAEGRGDDEPGATASDDRYPRITVYDGELRDVPVEQAPMTTSVRVTRVDDDLVATVNLLSELLGDGGCAGVLCNTVGRAQEAFVALRERFGDDVELHHSRFLAPERAARERRLVERLGPGASDRPRRLIVVGTQVLEQSLDIDFDVMVTDLAPVDLVLQRIGRLHRHASTPRPPGLMEPQLFVRGMDWSTAPPNPTQGKAIYGTAALLRAASVLDVSTIGLPTDIAPLVRAAYDPALPPPAGWDEAWAKAEERALNEASAAQNRASTYLLDPPWKPKTLDGFIDVDAGDPERDEARGRSQVRDSEDSLEVIALWRGDDGVLRLPPCAPRHPGAIVPTELAWGTAEDSLARAMAACTLPLPRDFTHEGVIDVVITELEKSVDGSAWQSSPWVAGQLIVVFDSSDSAQIVGCTLHYGSQGLTVSRNEEER